jgi:hypothetical protein
MKTIAQMTTAELIAEYNALTGKSIKKFSSRSAGESQLVKVRPTTAPKKETKVSENESSVYAFESHFLTHCPSCGTHLSNGVGEHGQEVNGKAIKHDEFEFACLACEHEFGSPIRKTAVSITRSKAISESWSNAKTAKKRARRDNVAVERVGTFRSVCQAFKQLNLPLNQHIKFRMSVKHDGIGMFEAGDKQYHFKLVEAQ